MMAKKIVLVAVLVCVAAVTAGCGDAGTLQGQIAEIGKAASFAYKEAAFLPISVENLQPIFGWVKVLAVIAFIVLAAVTMRWHDDGADDEEFNAGPGKWILILVIMGTIVFLLVAFDGLARAFWFNDLGPDLIRKALRWTIPVVEGAPNPDLNGTTLGIAVGLTLFVPLGHMAYEAFLVALVMLCLVWSVTSGSMRPMVIAGVAYGMYVAFAPLWEMGIKFIGMVGTKSPIPNSFLGVNFFFDVYTLGLILAVMIIPWLTPLFVPSDFGQRRPKVVAGGQNQRGGSAVETAQSVGAGMGAASAIYGASQQRSSGSSRTNARPRRGTDRQGRAVPPSPETKREGGVRSNVSGDGVTSASSKAPGAPQSGFRRNGGSSATQDGTVTPSPATARARNIKPPPPQRGNETRSTVAGASSATSLAQSGNVAQPATPPSAESVSADGDQQDAGVLEESGTPEAESSQRIPPIPEYGVEPVAQVAEPTQPAGESDLIVVTPGTAVTPSTSRVTYYAAVDLRDAVGGHYIFREGEQIFPEKVTDQGLIVKGELVPWLSVEKRPTGGAL